MKAKKLPSGSWRVQIQINGKRHSITRKTKKEAELAALKCSQTALSAPDCALGDLIDKYISDRANLLSPSTRERYERIRQDYFTRLMHLPLKDITEKRLQIEVNEMARTYAPKTVRTAYGLISSTLKANGVHYDITLPKQKPIEYHLPIEDQVFMMIDQASENLKTAILLAAFCSLRRSEIAALRAEDISGNMIHVKRAAVYGSGYKLIYRDDNKTYKSDRYIQAPDIVIDQLKGKTGRVCPIVPSTITANFIRLRNRLGLTCRFHDLRHFYASYLHAIGVRDQYIQKSGGWRSDAMLKAIYRNTLDDVEKQSAELLNDRINAHALHTDSEKSP